MTLSLDDLIKELRGTLAKMELALGAVKDAIAWTAEDGTIQWCNAAFDRLVNRSHIYNLGAPFSELFSFKESGLYEHTIQGQKRILEVSANPIKLPQGTSTVFSIRDITKLKETQNQLVQSEKMASVGQLASGVAHEVRNPLGIILQSVNYLELEISPDQKQIHEALQALKDAVKRADRIIIQLLDFSKPARPELKPASLQKTIDDSLELLAKKMALGRVQIKKNISQNLPLMQMNENEMQQVFINLFLNALQAMPDGGELSIDCSPKVLEESGGRVGHRSGDKFRVGQKVLVCIIKDRGKGIAPSNIHRIFDPFFTTKPPGEGTGLGLTITRAIIENHGGSISFQSEEGRGTQVTLLFPIAATY